MSTISYECKVKYRKTDETGGQKVVTEPYLVDALSYTEAESRINEEMSAYISEEFKITNIKVAIMQRFILSKMWPLVSIKSFFNGL